MLAHISKNMFFSYNKQGCKQTKWNWIPLCKLLWDVCWADVTVIKSLNHRCERQSEIDPCAVHREASFVCVCEGVEKWLLSPSVLFCDPDPYSAGTHTLWQPVQFTLTVDRTTGSELDTRPCVCVCACLHGATAEPALAQTPDIQRICSWWSQTFPPWRRAGDTAQYQTFCCSKKNKTNKGVIMWMDSCKISQSKLY